MDTVASLAWLNTRLAALPGVVVKREFGDQGYFLGPTRFAAVTPRGLVMHLPSALVIEALTLGIAKPFVSMGAMGRNGWVEFTSQALAPEVIERFVVAAHEAAGHAHRRSQPKRPATRRRTRGSAEPAKS